MQQIFKPAGQDKLLPDLEKNAQALINWGYTLEQSISDLIDNSLDAEAKKIHLIFKIPVQGRICFELHDNGNGMSASELKEAMRQGSKTKKAEKDLGKYGYGLKIASLNQSESLLVISKQKTVSAREISKESIQNEYECNYFSLKDSEEMWKLTKYFPKGTIISWKELNKYSPQTEKENNKLLNKILDRLENHLGLTFGRFIKKGIQLTYEIREESNNYKASNIQRICEIDPFGYERSGHKDFPYSTKVKDNNSHATIKFHIWSKYDAEIKNKSNYKLACGANEAQGMYIYRNDRLIQKGGWGFELSNDPHLSYARVEIDITGNADKLLNVDVTKTKANLTDSFYQLINNVKIKANKANISYSEYRSLAQEVYRSSKNKTEKKNFVLINSNKLSGTGIKVKIHLKKSGENFKIKVSNKKGWKIEINDRVIKNNSIPTNCKPLFLELIFTSVFAGLNENTSEQIINKRIQLLEKIL